MWPKLGRSGSFPGGRMLEEESSICLWLPHVCDRSHLSSHGGSPPTEGRMGSSKRYRASVDPSSRKQVVSFESWHFSVSSSDIRFSPPEATFRFVLFGQKSPHKASLQKLLHSHSVTATYILGGFSPCPPHPKFFGPLSFVHLPLPHIHIQSRIIKRWLLY